MIDVNLKINKEVFRKWLDLADMTQEEFTKKMGNVDPGNFSNMLEGKISTPKHVIEKVLGLTMLPAGQILETVIKEN